MLFRYSRRKKEADEILERTKTEDGLDLEKGDVLAIFIAAFITLMPILLVLFASVGLIYWLFIGRFL